VNTVFGGPIKRDRLWFLFAQRVSRSNNLIPLPLASFPQGGHSESGGQIAPHSTVRLTWQASPRNKLVWAFYKSQGGTERFDVGCTVRSRIDAIRPVCRTAPTGLKWRHRPVFRIDVAQRKVRHGRMGAGHAEDPEIERMALRQRRQRQRLQHCPADRVPARRARVWLSTACAISVAVASPTAHTPAATLVTRDTVMVPLVCVGNEL